jgi:hypothetical protein
MPPLDYAIDQFDQRLATAPATARARPAGHPLEQPLVFDYDGLWQHTLPLLDVLKSRYGHLPLTGLGGTYGWSVRDEEAGAYDKLNLHSLGQYVERFQRGDADLPYLRHVSLNRALPSLRQHIRDPEEFRPNWVSHRLLDRLGGPELFLGQAGTRFGCLHQDHASVHVGFVQLQGEKEFVMYPPDDAQYLYRWTTRHFPYQTRNSWLHYADLDNYERYPLLRFTRPKRVTVKAGQALLLPANWWHTTLNLSDSVSYSIRIVNRSNIGRVLATHLQGIPRLFRKPAV